MLNAAVLQPAVKSPYFHVLGVRVDAIQTAGAVATMERLISNGKPGCYVTVTGMHGVAESRGDGNFREILNAADLVVPDGMPLVWLGRLHGFPMRHRVPGSELMEEFCQKTGSRYRHFFYGGGPGVAEDLAKQLHARHGITIAGTFTPPYRPLTPEEEEQVARQVDESAADVLWVGLSTPKQEKWMHAHREAFRIPLMLGVGAAFDMNSGRLRRAPEWIRENGLEWLFRLVMEPRRLWKRYLVIIPRSVFSVSLELCRLKKFD
ncbi:MAG: WecB/TagA/CpsF family glycosyltransferase [Candidatus Acidiferrum sp.]